MKTSIASIGRRSALSLSLAATIALVACASPDRDGGPIAAHHVLSPPSLGLAGDSQAAVASDPVPARWWELLGDPLLEDLINQAGEANLDLEAAALRIEESRARLGLAESALKPTLSTGASYTRSGLSENSPLVRIGASPAPIDTWNLSLQAGWEIDLWGRLRALSTSANARLQASAYEREGARVTVAAEVARTYVLLRGIQAQLRIVSSNRQIASDLVRMAQSRQRNGVATRFDGAASLADLAAIDARRLQLVHQQDVLINALSLLLAKPPHELDARLSPPQPVPTAARLPVGLTSDIVRRRPDILQADAQLRAALSDIGAAKADFYPRVQLTGSFGFAGFEAGELSHWGSRQFSVGPKVYLPIFDGGRLKSNLTLSQVHHRLAATHYRKTVLRAWHEVDDALGAYASEHQRRDLLAEAVQQNRIALQVAQRGYQQGSSDFTTVLLANRALLSTEAELAGSETSSSLAIVALYRALGGGWDDGLAPSTSRSGVDS